MYNEKDNEFIAWYPNCLSRDNAAVTWSKRPAAFYVHIPFCTAICDYCGFSIERIKGANQDRYFGALDKEIVRYAESGRLSNYQFICGHFGGGTPSAVDAERISAIKARIESLCDVSSDAEYTIEVNPISFNASKSRTYLSSGINRLSFGIQSFDDEVLNLIGRPHRSDDVKKAIDTAASDGWTNISLDIIYGVPGQTVRQLEADLRRAASTGASHLSCFRLEIIPFTILKFREAAGLLPPRHTPDILDTMDEVVEATLAEFGFIQYGGFNFAKPGYESVHNRIAFMAPQGEYIGFGNSAYSFINDHVYCNHSDLGSYEQAVYGGLDPIAMAVRVSARERMSRFFVLGLKFFEVSRRSFIDEFGVPPENVFGETIRRLVDGGMILLKGDRYGLTKMGKLYLNNVCKEFYTPENRGVPQHLLFNPTVTRKQVEHFAKLATARRGSEVQP